MSKAKVAIVGCGFVGLSLGLAFKRAINSVEVVGHDKDRDAMRKAESAKAIDRGDWNLPNACDNAAAIFITIPQDGLDVTFKAIAPDLQPNTLVATVGGMNVSALKSAREWLPADVPFFATTLIYHPDRIEPATAAPDADSVRGAIWTIAPRSGASPAMVDVFTALVTQLDAKPIFVDATERDGMSVAVDVLPALLSSMLMLSVSNDAAWRERGWMAGAAFGQAVNDAEEAVTFASMLKAQPDATVYWLNQVMLQCMALRDAVQARNDQAVEQMLAQAEEKRQQWLADWRKGRNDGRLPIEKQSGVLSVFVGERMAGRITGAGARREKR